MKLMPMGDCGVTAEFGNSISPEINQKVRAMSILLKERKISGIISLVPTYRSLLVNYDPLMIHYGKLCAILNEINRNLSEVHLPAASIVEIPVLYGQTKGLDIEFVAKHNGISVEEVVKIHTSAQYLIYMLGFSPGFPYLGGMDERIAAPRLKTPRLKIPAGSVGIAGNQTGIYSIESPGGWQLIGRTPLRLYSPESANPFILSQGDYIQFVSVREKQYDEIEKEVIRGTYQIRTHLKGGE